MRFEGREKVQRSSDSLLGGSRGLISELSPKAPPFQVLADLRAGPGGAGDQRHGTPPRFETGHTNRTPPRCRHSMNLHCSVRVITTGSGVLLSITKLPICLRR